jgi:hypothetical protein
MLKVIRTFTLPVQGTSARYVRPIPPTLKATPLATRYQAQGVIVMLIGTSPVQGTSARYVRSIPPTLKATCLATRCPAQGAIATSTTTSHPQGTHAQNVTPPLRPTCKAIPLATTPHPQDAIASTISTSITQLASNVPYGARPVLQAQTLFLATPCVLAGLTGMF